LKKYKKITPGQMSLVAFLVGRLEEYAGFTKPRIFKFYSVLEFVKQRQTLVDAFEMMRVALVTPWKLNAVEWDTFCSD
jgi:hypothetical protein